MADMLRIEYVYDMYTLKELFDQYIMPYIEGEPLFYPEAVVMGTAMCVIKNEKVAGLPNIYNRVLNNYAIPTNYVLEFINKFEKFIYDTIDNVLHVNDKYVRLSVGMGYTLICTEYTNANAMSFKEV